MSETNESQQPSEPPAPSAPLPGVRIRPPGAAPKPPEPDANEQLHRADEPTSPAGPTSPPPADRAGETRRTRRPRAERSDSESARGSHSQPGPTTAPTSTTTSTDDGARREPEPPPAAFVEPIQLTADLAGFLLAISDDANERFAPPGTPLFLADEHEAVGVARPAARVIARHMPAGMGGGGNPDLADAVSAVIVLCRYGLRQVRLYHAIRRARAAARDVDEQGTEQPAPADPLLHPVA